MPTQTPDPTPPRTDQTPDEDRDADKPNRQEAERRDQERTAPSETRRGG